MACYPAAPQTLGVGPCRQGFSQCIGSVRGPCVAAVVPEIEICNRVDDDCDGEADEGLRSACGTCGPCERACFGPPEACEEWGEAGPGVVETGEGWLALEAVDASAHVIWPSSSATGVILRVSTTSFEIEGAYYTGSGVLRNTNSPSRTAVDDEGNAYISNRGGFADGSVTKIASSDEGCVDRDGDGLETSRGWNDVLAFANDEEWDDECILWHTVTREHPGAIVLAADVGLDGSIESRAWVGLYVGHRFVELDADTGEPTDREVAGGAFSPYGAAIDRDGIVWSVGLDAGRVGRFDSRRPEDGLTTIQVPGPLAHRILVDENDAPWVCGTFGATGGLWRYDRAAETFEEARLADPCLNLAGEISLGDISSDGQGSIWVGTWASNECVYRVKNAPGAEDDLENHTIATPGVPSHGMAVDFDGHAWTTGYTSGSAAVVDLETESAVEVLDDCDGAPCLLVPYTRGDLTGRQRRNATGDLGAWSAVVEGCDEGDTSWRDVRIDGDVPESASLVVSTRTAETLEYLSHATWSIAGTLPEDGSTFAIGDGGGLLEVRVVLQSMWRTASPVLRGVEVSWGCEDVVE